METDWLHVLYFWSLVTQSKKKKKKEKNFYVFVPLKLHVKIIIAQLGKATFWREANFSRCYQISVEVCHHSKTSTSFWHKSITTSSFGQMRSTISWGIRFEGKEWRNEENKSEQKQVCCFKLTQVWYSILRLYPFIGKPFSFMIQVLNWLRAWIKLGTLPVHSNLITD